MNAGTGGRGHVDDRTLCRFEFGDQQTRENGGREEKSVEDGDPALVARLGYAFAIATLKFRRDRRIVDDGIGPGATKALPDLIGQTFKAGRTGQIRLDVIVPDAGSRTVLGYRCA